MTYKVHPIGIINNSKNRTFIELNTQFIPALKGLDGFSHLNIFWWCNELDREEFRTMLETRQPYQTATDKMGIFATRSPIRPNPIALTTVEIIDINYQNGRIQIANIDAYHHSPLIDIKPYIPSLDRVENPNIPEWCRHWPKSTEAFKKFSWEKEFNN